MLSVRRESLQTDQHIAGCVRRRCHRVVAHAPGLECCRSSATLQCRGVRRRRPYRLPQNSQSVGTHKVTREAAPAAQTGFGSSSEFVQCRADEDVRDLESYAEPRHCRVSIAAATREASRASQTSCECSVSVGRRASEEPLRRCREAEGGHPQSKRSSALRDLGGRAAEVSGRGAAEDAGRSAQLG